MAAIEKMSLTGKYGEIVQVHPLQHTPDIVVEFDLKVRDDYPLMKMRLYYAFISLGVIKDNLSDLLDDIREHVDQCMAIDNFNSPTGDREGWMDVGFSSQFVSKHPYMWTTPPKVIA